MNALDVVRIGILGSARIAYDGIVVPARDSGCRLVAVAARDAERARQFADSHGVERSGGDYRAVVEAADVDLVYNPLPNALHAPWNLAAIAAGKHVLSEKPFASNAGEAALVRDRGVGQGVVVADGFHYRYHPVTVRLHELLSRGDLGELVRVEAVVNIPRPPVGDLRLSADLAGGALMDGGCYALHAVNVVGEVVGPPRLATVEGQEFADLPGIDERVVASFDFPGGARGQASCWMGAPEQELSCTVVGTEGSARVENFILPHTDDRLTLQDRRSGRTWVEHHGTRSSYTYQLEALLRAIRYGDPLPTDSSDAVVTMAMVDECYRRLGMEPRRGVMDTGS